MGSVSGSGLGRGLGLERGEEADVQRVVGWGDN